MMRCSSSSTTTIDGAIFGADVFFSTSFFSPLACDAVEDEDLGERMAGDEVEVRETG